MKLTNTLQKMLGTVVLSLIMAASAFALELHEAKSKGMVGETNSGYLAAIKPSNDVNSLIRDINGQRKAQYEKIAKKNKISLEAVEVRAGKKAIAKTPSGQYVNTGGGWKKK